MRKETIYTAEDWYLRELERVSKQTGEAGEDPVVQSGADAHLTSSVVRIDNLQVSLYYYLSVSKLYNGFATEHLD